MKIIKRISQKSVFALTQFKRRQIDALRASLFKVKLALSQEKAETREMLQIYRLYLRKQASAQDMKVANKQFGDLLKGLGLGVFAVLPFAPITIPVIVKLGKVVGVDILPSAFSTKVEVETPKLEDK